MTSHTVVSPKPESTSPSAILLVGVVPSGTSVWVAANTISAKSTAGPMGKGRKMKLKIVVAKTPKTCQASSFNPSGGGVNQSPTPTARQIPAARHLRESSFLGAEVVDMAAREARSRGTASDSCRNRASNEVSTYGSDRARRASVTWQARVYRPQAQCRFADEVETLAVAVGVPAILQLISWISLQVLVHVAKTKSSGFDFLA